MCYLKEAMSIALTETDTKDHLIAPSEVYGKHTMHFEQYNNNRNKHIHRERERERDIHKYTDARMSALCISFDSFDCNGTKRNERKNEEEM